MANHPTVHTVRLNMKVKPMRSTLVLSFVLVALLILVGCRSSEPQEPAQTQPSEEHPTTPTEGLATKPSSVPAELLQNMKDLFEPPEGEISESVRVQMLNERMPKVLALGAQAESQYGDAGNLHVARQYMVQAADYLYSRRKDPASRQLLLDIAGRIISSSAPIHAKIQADFVITHTNIRPLEGEITPEETTKLIGEMVERYEQTPFASTALISATILAVSNEQVSLAEQFLDKLQTEHLGDPHVRAFLRRTGRDPYVGQTFAAELTKLDGEKLSLPNDLKGKVVVIDFWATWCRPCRLAMPKLKKLYAKYKDRGIEMVGIALDEGKSEVQKVVTDEELNWIHTFSGQASEDPTAARYNVIAIPSVWIVGRDGKIISSMGYGQLEPLIVQALENQVPPADQK